MTLAAGLDNSFVCALLISTTATKAQANSFAPAFEVATIKPVEPNGSHPHDLNVYPGGRILIRGYSPRSLIVTAYTLSSWQLSGGDSSMNNDQYDIEAIPPFKFNVNSL